MSRGTLKVHPAWNHPHRPDILPAHTLHHRPQLQGSRKAAGSSWVMPQTSNDFMITSFGTLLHTCTTH